MKDLTEKSIEDLLEDLKQLIARDQKVTIKPTQLIFPDGLLNWFAKQQGVSREEALELARRLVQEAYERSQLS